MRVARVAVSVVAFGLALSALGLLGLTLFARDTLLAAFIETVLSAVGADQMPAAAQGGVAAWMTTAAALLMGSAAVLWVASRRIGRTT